MEEMEAPPAPRSQSWIPSPVKRQLPTLTPQTYRAANLRAAKIFVEDLNELPSAIDDAVRQIVPISAWTGSTVALEEHLVTAAAWYQAESHRNTRKVSLERHWTCSLYSVVKTLVYPLNSDLRTSVEGKGSILVNLSWLFVNMLTSSQSGATVSSQQRHYLTRIEERILVRHTLQAQHNAPPLALARALLKCQLQARL